MAQLTFVGAAGTVTGSKHLVTCRGGRFYIDSGMFQGPTRDIESLNAVPLPFPRHRDHPELLRLRREALGLLGMAQDW